MISTRSLDDETEHGAREGGREARVARLERRYLESLSRWLSLSLTHDDDSQRVPPLLMR